MVKKANKKSQKRRSTNVPDTYRGFSVQATRFLYYLLKAELDDIVSLEYFEDVGVEKPNGTRIAEQDKSYRTSNPLADRSVVFWKTLRNWVDGAKDGTLPPDKTSFVAYAPNAQIGEIVQSFKDSTSVEEAKAALNKAREILQSCDGWKIGKSAEEHVDVVFTADQNLVVMLLVNLSVDVSCQNAEDALKPVLLQKFVGPDSFDIVIRQAHGWVKQEIDKFVNAGKPVRILKKDFHNPLLNFIRTHDRTSILRSVASSPSDEDVEAELAFRDYVKQLRIIDLEEIDILEAVNDFLSAAIDRTVWAEKGMISKEALESFEDELGRTWKNKRRKTQLAHSQLDFKDQGQLIYSDCMDHDARVDSLETPRQFIRGSWHALADDKTIGWHPNYQTELAAITATTVKESA